MGLKITNKDLHNQISAGVAIALTAVADSEDVAGVAIDRQGSDGLEIIFQVGAYTDGSVTPLIEESDDNVTYTAVADADLTNTEASAALTALVFLTLVMLVLNAMYGQRL